MKGLNAEYEIMFERVKRIQVNKDSETYERETDKTPEEFQALIAELIKMEGIEECLRELGFRWHRKNVAGIDRLQGIGAGTVVITTWTMSKHV